METTKQKVAVGLVSLVLVGLAAGTSVARWRAYQSHRAAGEIGKGGFADLTPGAGSGSPDANQADHQAIVAQLRVLTDAFNHHDLDPWYAIFTPTVVVTNAQNVSPVPVIVAVSDDAKDLTAHPDESATVTLSDLQIQGDQATSTAKVHCEALLTAADGSDKASKVRVMDEVDVFAWRTENGVWRITGITTRSHAEHIE
jgi:ketosteroid isomerase-like protein